MIDIFNTIDSQEFIYEFTDEEYEHNNSQVISVKDITESFSHFK